MVWTGQAVYGVFFHPVKCNEVARNGCEKPAVAHLKPSPTVTISTSLSVDVTLISSLAGTGGAGAGVDSITTTSSSRAPGHSGLHGLL